MQADMEIEFSALNAKISDCYQKDNFHDAMLICKQQRDMVKQEMGQDNLWYAAAINCLGEVYTALSQFSLAEVHLEKARDIRLRLAGEESPQHAETMISYARLYEPLGKLDEAAALYEKALALYDQLGDKDNQWCEFCRRQIETIQNALADLEPGQTTRLLSQAQISYELENNYDGPVYDVVMTKENTSPEEWAELTEELNEAMEKEKKQESES